MLSPQHNSTVRNGVTGYPEVFVVFLSVCSLIPCNMRQPSPSKSLPIPYLSSATHLCNSTLFWRNLNQKNNNITYTLEKVSVNKVIHVYVAGFHFIIWLCNSPAYQHLQSSSIFNWTNIIEWWRNRMNQQCTLQWTRLTLLDTVLCCWHSHITSQCKHKQLCTLVWKLCGSAEFLNANLPVSSRLTPSNIRQGFSVNHYKGSFTTIFFVSPWISYDLRKAYAEMFVIVAGFRSATCGFSCSCRPVC